ncbi:MAG: transaldolase family protein [Halothece sp. Uz-M2-17]|nr:transaldolase family protein [Halothece sp. Uz-M2-17]
MIEIYLDTADVEQVKRLAKCIPLQGITTNPTILANSERGVHQSLSELREVLGDPACFHVQVISRSAEDMVTEALKLAQLPYNIVVKIPATEQGLIAIRELKKQQIKVLATVIYTVQQGLTAALCGADYLAPYVNRIDTIGSDGLRTVADLQALLDQYELPSQILAASFKSVQQVVGVMKIGVAAVTLPVNVAEQLFNHPVIETTVDQFNQDWKQTFGEKLSFET